MVSDDRHVHAGPAVTDPPWSPMIAAILPPDVVAAESQGSLPDAMLLPEEEAAIRGAVAHRRREFTAARCLARRALGRLGFHPVPILHGTGREPLWPEGIVGSITHCPGYCAAVVARRALVASVGIDAEVHAPLPPGVIGLVTRDEERQWLDRRAAGAVCWDRVLFSAKESVFKAWFPLAGRWLGFHAVRVIFNPGAGTFRAHLLAERPIVDGSVMTCFDGRYLVQGQHVLTSVTIVTRVGVRTSSSFEVPGGTTG